MLEVINDFLSGKVLIVLMVGLGGYFTIRSRFVQFRYFLHMFSVFKDSLRSSAGELSSFQALMLSLAGRVGAGNIAGVGIAVTLGGPGAVFWMWVSALVGMSSSLIECSLGQLYKRRDAEGQLRGGPSFYMKYGLGKIWMGKLMAVLLLITFGFAFMGLQAHAVTHSLQDAFGFKVSYSGFAIAILLGLVFIGGIKRIASVADLLVPVKTLAYIAVTLYVIVLQFDHVPAMLGHIVKSAFGLDPVFGGLIGSAIVMGVKRGVFANEAGLGSAPNVAAVVGEWGRVFISVALALFVFTSMLYNYYLGENNLRFLVGESRKALMGYRALVLVLIFWGSIENLQTVFAFADIAMTMLAFVNLVALAMLFKICMRVLKDYDDQRRAGIKTPVFDSSKFPDLNLDLKAWPPLPAAKAEEIKR